MELLYVKDRSEWRAWLEENHDKSNGVRLIYYKKHTGKPRIPYDDAVEEALCFGWIDTTVHRLDDERYAQQFRPRNRNSVWAISNKRRVEKMIAQGKMTPAGMELVEAAKKSGAWKNAYGKPSGRVPTDMKKALEKDKKAMEFFRGLNKTNRYYFIHWVVRAKRPETRKARIEKSIAKLSSGKKFFEN